MVFTASVGLTVSVYSVQASTRPGLILLLVGPSMESGYECMELPGPSMEPQCECMELMGCSMLCKMEWGLFAMESELLGVEERPLGMEWGLVLGSESEVELEWNEDTEGG